MKHTAAQLRQADLLTSADIMRTNLPDLINDIVDEDALMKLVHQSVSLVEDTVPNPGSTPKDDAHDNLVTAMLYGFFWGYRLAYAE